MCTLMKGNIDSKCLHFVIQVPKCKLLHEGDLFPMSTELLIGSFWSSNALNFECQIVPQRDLILIFAQLSLL